MSSTTAKAPKQFSHGLLILLAFLAGLTNAQGYIDAIGTGFISNLIQVSFYLVLFLCIVLNILQFLLKKKRLSPKSIYWIPITLIVSIKFLMLFFLEPSIFSPNKIIIQGEPHRYFKEFITFFTNISLLIVIAGLINNIKRLKAAIWSCGIGIGISVLIPFVFFPEMIGNRGKEVDGIEFYGFFWNPSVISFITIFWLFFALMPTIESKLKKFILIAISLVIILGGIAGLSRGILVSLFFSVSAYLLYSRKLKVTVKLIIIMITLVFIVYIFFPTILENYGGRINTGKSIFEEARVHIWGEYLRNIGNYFIFGAWMEGPRYSSQGFGPHSIILNWWTRFGIFGLLSFLWMIYGLFTSMKYVKNYISLQHAAAIFAWIVAYFSVALINETGFTQTSIYVAFGVILAWGDIAYKEKFGLENKQ